jgi:hypothetical protein
LTRHSLTIPFQRRFAEMDGPQLGHELSPQLRPPRGRAVSQTPLAAQQENRATTIALSVGVTTNCRTRADGAAGPRRCRMLIADVCARVG